MNQSSPFFHLYCVNNQCGASIYKNPEAVEVSITKENLIATYCCSNCRQRMISSIDAEIEQLLAVTDVVSHYHLNYN